MGFKPSVYFASIYRAGFYHGMVSLMKTESSYKWFSSNAQTLYSHDVPKITRSRFRSETYTCTCMYMHVHVAFCGFSMSLIFNFLNLMVYCYNAKHEMTYFSCQEKNKVFEIGNVLIWMPNIHFFSNVACCFKIFPPSYFMENRYLQKRMNKEHTGNAQSH